jgi:hypothetical protein
VPQAVTKTCGRYRSLKACSTPRTSSAAPRMRRHSEKMRDMEPDVLRRFFPYRATQLQGLVDAVRDLISHQLTKGIEAELAVADPAFAFLCCASEGNCWLDAHRRAVLVETCGRSSQPFRRPGAGPVPVPMSLAGALQAKQGQGFYVQYLQGRSVISRIGKSL